MYGKLKDHLTSELTQIENNGLLKRERVITSPQGAEVKISTGDDVVIMCANNYLGLSSHPEVIQASKDALDTHGYGMSSVRFICGTQDIHKNLERKIAEFYGTEDTILYAAAFDANGGLFEPLFGKEDAIISDELNHASIIDGGGNTTNYTDKARELDLNLQFTVNVPRATDQTDFEAPELDLTEFLEFNEIV